MRAVFSVDGGNPKGGEIGVDAYWLSCYAMVIESASGEVQTTQTAGHCALFRPKPRDDRRFFLWSRCVSSGPGKAWRGQAV